jgi:hypothetical protein
LHEHTWIWYRDVLTAARRTPRKLKVEFSEFIIDVRNFGIRDDGIGGFVNQSVDSMGEGVGHVFDFSIVRAVWVV